MPLRDGVFIVFQLMLLSEFQYTSTLFIYEECLEVLGDDKHRQGSIVSVLLCCSCRHFDMFVISNIRRVTVAPTSVEILHKNDTHSLLKSSNC